MPNQNPVDDLDFTPQTPSSSPKKGISRRTMKGIATLLLVLASGLGGYAVNSLMSVSAGDTVTITAWSSLSQAATVYEGVPDSNYAQGVAYPRQGIYSYWGYMTFPLSARPTGFTSAVVNLLCKGYNFTWVNVSLVTTDWNDTSITWNTRPTPGVQIADIPVKPTISFENVTFDVTSWVGSGANLSICLTVLYNNTKAEFAGGPHEGFIAWSYGTPVSGEMMPYVIVVLAAVIAVVAMILMTRKHGGS